MRLANYQTAVTVNVIVTAEELRALPDPDFILDFQTGEYCAEYVRTPTAMVALRLAGVHVEELQQ